MMTKLEPWLSEGFRFCGPQKANTGDPSTKYTYVAVDPVHSGEHIPEMPFENALRYPYLVEAKTIIGV